MRPRPTGPRDGASRTDEGGRPHWAARAEDRFNAVLSRSLRSRGWLARAEPFTGYGTPRQVRVLARIVLQHPHSPVRPAAGPHEPVRAVRGWRSFLVAAAVHTPVTVALGGHTFEAVADRGGYLDVTVDVALAPGWHQATLTTVDEQVTVCPVLVIGDGPRLGVVSDIDDTVMVTALPRPLLAGWNALVLHESARRVVPGMPVLYAEIEHRHPGTPVVYLSTGAWNVAPALRRFLAAHGFPAGPLLLTDWGPTNTGLFRSGRRHKDENLRRLVEMFPDIEWLLIGDDGQHDPEIYGDIARRHPDRVRAVVLRQLTPSEHVLAHGGTAAVDRLADTGTPVFRGHDGTVLRSVLEQHGVL